MVVVVLAISALFWGGGDTVELDSSPSDGLAAAPAPAGLSPTTMPNSTTTSLGATTATTASTTTTTTATTPPGEHVEVATDVDPFASVAGCSVATDAVAATADGGPCPVALTLAAGVLTLPDAEFQIDLPHAAVAIGDFACDGHVRPAFVDLAEGHIFVFDQWASAASSANASAIQRIDAPRQLLAEPNADGCHQLVALDDWGIRHVIDISGKTTP